MSILAKLKYCPWRTKGVNLFAASGDEKAPQCTSLLSSQRNKRGHKPWLRESPHRHPMGLRCCRRVCCCCWRCGSWAGSHASWSGTLNRSWGNVLLLGTSGFPADSGTENNATLDRSRKDKADALRERWKWPWLLACRWLPSTLQEREVTLFVSGF